MSAKWSHKKKKKHQDSSSDFIDPQLHLFFRLLHITCSSPINVTIASESMLKALPLFQSLIVAPLRPSTQLLNSTYLAAVVSE